MLIRLLGWPAVVQENGEFNPLTPRIAETVAVLATSRGREISTRRLSEMLFPKVELDKADLRTRLKVVRRQLRGATVSNAAGWVRFDIDPDQVDCLRFEALAERAKREQGGARARLLGEALELWSEAVPFEGTALSCLDEERSRLERLRDEAHCGLVDALVADHQPDEAWVYARSVPPGSRDSEGFLMTWAVLLAERGETRELRSVIPEYECRTGAAASQALREHVTALLRDGSPLRKPRVTIAGIRVPRELPAGLTELTGRSTEKAALAQCISRRDRVVVVRGQAGAGKTALAVAVARERQNDFDGGTLFVDLRGFSADPPRDPRQRLRTWLSILGVSVREYGLDDPDADVEDLAALYRSVLAVRAVLVVLDNAVDADQVRLLLPPPGQSACLITTRADLRLVEVAEVEVCPWNSETGLAFLADGPAVDRVAADPASARKIVEYCGGLPLALTAVKARLRMHRNLALGAVVAALTDRTGRLGALDQWAAGPRVSAVLGWSVNALQKGAGDAFRRIGAAPELAVTVFSLSYLLSGTRSDPSAVIEELVAANVVSPADQDGVFVMHDLFRACAVVLAEELDSEPRRQAEEQAQEFALHQAIACDQILDPTRALLAPEASTDGAVCIPESVTAAVRLGEAIYPLCEWALDRASRLKQHQYSMWLPVVLAVFYRKTGRWADQVKGLRQASDATRFCGTPAEQARVWRHLGSAYNYVGSHALAVLCQERGIRIGIENSDAISEARGAQALGIAHEKAGQIGLARPCFERAVQLFESLGDQRGLAHARNGIASVRFAEGDLPGALELTRTALAAAESAEDVNGQGAILRTRARICNAAGDVRAAVDSYLEAVRRYQDDGYVTAAAKACRAAADLLVETSPERARALRSKADALLASLPVADA